MELTLVCEGEAEGFREGRFPAGRPLAARGAAAAAAMRLPRARCWASPAAAALATATALGLSPEPETALAEIDHGRWCGLRLADVAAAEPDAFAAWLVDPAAAPHGGETRAAAFARVAAWLDGRLGGEGGVVVAGASVVRLLVAHALGAGAGAPIDVEPLATVRLTGDGRRFRLRFSAPGR